MRSFKNREQQATEATARRHYRETVRHLEKELKCVRGEMAGLVAGDPQLAAKADLLRGIPGIAELSSLQILAELPMNLIGEGRALACYAGIVPGVEQSGTSIHRSRLSRQGNAHLRHRLYLAAIVAGCRCPELKAFKERIVSKGKSKKTAILAVAHKLLRVISVMLSRNIPFDRERLQNPR